MIMENNLNSAYSSAKSLFSSMKHLKSLYVNKLYLNNELPIKGMFTGEVTYSTRSIAAGGISLSNFTVPGASVGDICIINNRITPGTHCFIDEGYVSAENTLTITGKCTHDTASQTIGNMVVRYLIIDIT